MRHAAWQAPRPTAATSLRAPGGRLVAAYLGAPLTQLRDSGAPVSCLSAGDDAWWWSDAVAQAVGALRGTPFGPGWTAHPAAGSKCQFRTKRGLISGLSGGTHPEQRRLDQLVEVDIGRCFQVDHR